MMRVLGHKTGLSYHSLHRLSRRSALRAFPLQEKERLVVYAKAGWMGCTTHYVQAKGWFASKS